LLGASLVVLPRAEIGFSGRGVFAGIDDGKNLSIESAIHKHHDARLANLLVGVDEGLGFGRSVNQKRLIMEWRWASYGGFIRSWQRLLPLVVVSRGITPGSRRGDALHLGAGVAAAIQSGDCERR